jgi:hypothetical protein
MSEELTEQHRHLKNHVKAALMYCYLRRINPERLGMLTAITKTPDLAFQPLVQRSRYGGVQKKENQGKKGCSRLAGS